MNEKLNFSQMDLLKFCKNKSKRRDLIKNSTPHLSKSQTHKKMFPMPGRGQKGRSFEDPRLWVELEGALQGKGLCLRNKDLQEQHLPLGIRSPASNLLQFVIGLHQSLSLSLVVCYSEQECARSPEEGDPILSTKPSVQLS